MHDGVSGSVHGHLEGNLQSCSLEQFQKCSSMVVISVYSSTLQGVECETSGDISNKMEKME